MTIEEATAAFSSLSHDEKKEFIAQLIYELTIVARDSYEVGGVGLTNPERVRRVNEVQHRLGAFLFSLLRDDARRYPDDLLVRIILEHEGDDDFQRQMSAAFAAAYRLTATAKVS